MSLVSLIGILIVASIIGIFCKGFKSLIKWVMLVAMILYVVSKVM